MNIYVYSDESGVLDKKHNRFFTFGGLVFLSKEDKDDAARKYLHAERAIRTTGNYKGIEIKAATIPVKEKQKLYRSLNRCYKFGVIIRQDRVLDSIMTSKKSKQRFLDYAFKIGVKRLLQRLIRDSVIDPHKVKNVYVFVDEHTTATDGRYELQEALEGEFKYGTHSHNFTNFFPPIFPTVDSVCLKFCNSEKVPLIRAADIIANRLYHDITANKPIKEFNGEDCRMLVVHVP